MPNHRTDATLELIPATLAQQPILANLLELYAHDFSEFYDVVPGPDGRFGYRALPLYWTDPDRYPFLFTLDRTLSGFVFVKREAQVPNHDRVWDVAEFFVMRHYRRQGIGTRIAHQVWSRFPGPWQVRVLQSNISAFEFWSRAIAMFVGQTIHPVLIEKDGERWNVFSFTSKCIPSS